MPRSFRAVPFLLAALTLSACAGTGAAGPNGWFAPRGERAHAERPAERTAQRDAPRDRDRVTSQTRRRPAAGPSAPVRPASDRAEARASRPSSALVIPVVGIEGRQLRDSFTAPRSGGRTHNAIDIAAPRGTPLVAIVDGTITRKHWNGLGGNTLYLTSADGRTDYYYAHLDAYADGVEIGTRVRRGDVIGTVGATGNAQGPHLHLQVLDKRGGGRGTPVNPYDLLRAAPSAD